MRGGAQGSSMRLSRCHGEIYLCFSFFPKNMSKTETKCPFVLILPVFLAPCFESGCKLIRWFFIRVLRAFLNSFPYIQNHFFFRIVSGVGESVIVRNLPLARRSDLFTCHQLLVGGFCIGLQKQL